MKKLSLMFAVLLAGCGGGGSSRPDPQSPPAPMADAFFAQVLAVVASAPDDNEAAGTDAVAATAPEDSEPSAL
jgi:hypothetical protein